MITLDIIHVVGLSVFLFFSVINTIIFIIKMLLIRIFIRKELELKQNIKTNGIDIYNEIHPTIWGYFTLSTASLIFAFLYAALWQGIGITQKPSTAMVQYGRWIALAIVAGLFIFYSSYKIYIINTHSSIHQSSFKIQSLFSIFYGIFSMLFLTFATLAQTLASRILLIVASILSVVIFIILLFIPTNTFFEINYVVNKKFHRIPKGSNFKSGTPIDINRTVFILVTLAYYIINIIIWFISESNEFLTSNGLNFDNESIAYLVLDFLYICFLTIYTSITAFTKKDIPILKNL